MPELQTHYEGHWAYNQNKEAENEQQRTQKSELDIPTLEACKWRGSKEQNVNSKKHKRRQSTDQETDLGSTCLKHKPSIPSKQISNQTDQASETKQHHPTSSKGEGTTTGCGLWYIVALVWETVQLWDASNAARSLCNTRTVTPSAMTDSRSTSFSLLRYSINSLEGGGKGLAAPTNDAKETAKKKDDFNSVMKRKKTIHHITKEKDGILWNQQTGSQATGSFGAKLLQVLPCRITLRRTTGEKRTDEETVGQVTGTQMGEPVKTEPLRKAQSWLINR